MTPPGDGNQLIGGFALGVEAFQFGPRVEGDVSRAGKIHGQFYFGCIRRNGLLGQARRSHSVTQSDPSDLDVILSSYQVGLRAI